MEHSSINSPRPVTELVASEYEVEDREIEVADGLGHERRYRTIGGTTLLKENIAGRLEERATQGFMSYQDMTSDPLMRGRTNSPLIVIQNGGPSTPVTRHNALVIGGPFMVRYSPDGRPLPEPLINYESLTRHGGPVVGIDPLETGLGKRWPSQPENWHNGMQRDIDSTTASLVWFMDKYRHHDRALVFVGTSAAAGRMVGMAVELEKKGVPVHGIVFISAGMDNSTSFIKKHESNKPYITGLPAMSMVSQYHERRHRPYGSIKRDSLERVADFALDEYANALDMLEHNKLGRDARNRMIGQLAHITGLSRKLIDEYNLKIDADIFAQNRLPGIRLSTLDGRIAYPADTVVKTDPLLDETMKVHGAIIEKQGFELGYPTLIQTQEYKDIAFLYYKGWDFTGWESEDLYEPMAELFEKLPGLRVAEISGMYDLNCSPPRQHLFWEKLRSEYRYFPLTKRDQLVPRPDLTGPTVDTYMLPTAHQLNYDPYARGVLYNILGDVISQVEADFLPPRSLDRKLDNISRAIRRQKRAGTWSDIPPEKNPHGL